MCMCIFRQSNVSMYVYFQIPSDGDVLQLLHVRAPRRAALATDLQHARQHRTVQEATVRETTRKLRSSSEFITLISCLSSRVHVKVIRYQL